MSVAAAAVSGFGGAGPLDDGFDQWLQRGRGCGNDGDVDLDLRRRTLVWASRTGIQRGTERTDDQMRRKIPSSRGWSVSV